MAITIYHLTTPDGNHSYYTSRAGLVLDNAEEGLPVGAYTLDRHDWTVPWEKDGWVIRKGDAWTTNEIRAYHEGLNRLTPDDFK